MWVYINLLQARFTLPESEKVTTPAWNNNFTVGVEYGNILRFVPYPFSWIWDVCAFYFYRILWACHWYQIFSSSRVGYEYGLISHSCCPSYFVLCWKTLFLMLKVFCQEMYVIKKKSDIPNWNQNLPSQFSLWLITWFNTNTQHNFFFTKLHGSFMTQFLCNWKVCSFSNLFGVKNAGLIVK